MYLEVNLVSFLTVKFFLNFSTVDKVTVFTAMSSFFGQPCTYHFTFLILSLSLLVSFVWVFHSVFFKKHQGHIIFVLLSCLFSEYLVVSLTHIMFLMVVIHSFTEIWSDIQYQYTFACMTFDAADFLYPLSFKFGFPDLGLYNLTDVLKQQASSTAFTLLMFCEYIFRRRNVQFLPCSPALILSDIIIVYGT